MWGEYHLRELALDVKRIAEVSVSALFGALTKHTRRCARYRGTRGIGSHRRASRAKGGRFDSAAFAGGRGCGLCTSGVIGGGRVLAAILGRPDDRGDCCRRSSTFGTLTRRQTPDGPRVRADILAATEESFAAVRAQSQGRIF